MRQVLTTLLALHWALVFALLAFICIDGSRGVSAALGMLGITVQSPGLADLENVVVVAPLATALMVVAVLFCWAFVETLISTMDMDSADSVLRIAFISAFGLLSLILVGGAAQGINGLFMVIAIQMAALLASYVAMLAERRSTASVAVPGKREIRAAHAMAKGAVHDSLLSRISGRPDTNRKDGR
ncbi:hypothetical protein LGH82_02600 [Mesorhizobium sp. PAMC28654]|uniref:hypothetical protein n=1 Tax=Mesorhizobium sp. PAMC28654 TaxID=2880934 RepID=UPI001D0A4CA7|nr:hypothetical protein [Mesorhizobium sp. PAMC28654]UDL90293.1 hypothetical protein LGH82_02600 [Mesorhizobium sp. PAMC28654]